VHPVQPPVHADQFDVPHDLIELLDMLVLVHKVHGGLVVPYSSHEREIAGSIPGWAL
jgi:hypothetical protein